jgi:hypothetical protein
MPTASKSAKKKVPEKKERPAPSAVTQRPAKPIQPVVLRVSQSDLTQALGELLPRFIGPPGAQHVFGDTPPLPSAAAVADQRMDTKPAGAPIPEAVRRLHAALDEFDTILHTLSERLSPVLAYEAEDQGKATLAPLCAPETGTSGIAHNFNHAANHVGYLHQRVIRLLKRLELPEESPPGKLSPCGNAAAPTSK